MQRGGCHGKHTSSAESLNEQMRNGKTHQTKSLLLSGNDEEKRSIFHLFLRVIISLNT